MHSKIFFSSLQFSKATGKYRKCEVKIGSANQKAAQQKTLIVFTWWDCNLCRNIGTASATSTKSCAATAEHVSVPSNIPTILQAHFCTLVSLLFVSNAWIMHWFSNESGKLSLIRAGFLSSPFPEIRSFKRSFVGDTDSRNSRQKLFPPGCSVKNPRDVMNHPRNQGIQGNMVLWIGTLPRNIFTCLLLNQE